MAQFVEFSDQLDVLFEDALVLLAVFLCLLGELVSQGPHVVFNLSSLLVVNLVEVCRA